MWKCFSPFTVASEKGIEYEGAIIALFHFLIIKNRKMEAFRLAFFRRSGPNLLQVSSTLFIILLIMYLWRFKVDIKLTSKRESSYKSSLDIIKNKIFILRKFQKKCNNLI